MRRPCTYQFALANPNIPYTATADVVTVRASPQNCAWTAASGSKVSGTRLDAAQVLCAEVYVQRFSSAATEMHS
jgi:hypothetical protein